MSRERIGQVLSQMGMLSPIDVNEILAEQNISHRRFGQIALSWGLCEPRHVWQAWFDQLAGQEQRVDLETVGIDAQATPALTRHQAQQWHAIPIRRFDATLVVATASAPGSAARAEMEQTLGDRAHFVLADLDQIAMAIRAYYPQRLAV